jgi:hypothetical protein
MKSPSGALDGEKPLEEPPMPQRISLERITHYIVMPTRALRISLKRLLDKNAYYCD